MREMFITALAVFLSLSISGFLCVQSTQFITERGPRWPDDRGNITMAYNLYKHNVLSVDVVSDSPLQPSCHREPITPLSVALLMRFHPGFQSEWKRDELMKNGAPMKVLKDVNLIWLFLALVGVWWAVRLLGGNLLISSVALLLVYGVGFIHGILNYILSEIPASACLVWSSVFLLLAYKNKSLLLCILAGVALALLTLTKAVFYYVFFPIPLILMGLLLLNRTPRRQCLLLPMMLCIGFGLVVYPYMLRNYHHFNQFKITARGGVVLLIRANKNDMNWTEIKGAFYHWAPQGYQPAIGKILGFSDEDLKKGGRLQRLNRHMYVRPSKSGTVEPVPQLATLGMAEHRISDPEFAKADQRAVNAGRPEDAISFIYSMSADRRKSFTKFRRSGAEHPHQEGDRELRSKAVSMIKQRPFRHLALTPLFLWRGIGEIPGANPWLPYFARSGWFRATAHLLFFLSIWVLPLIALYRRRFEVFLFLMPAIGMMLFYGLFSHNILRYNVPAYPIMVISFFLVAAWVIRGLYSSIRRRYAGKI